MKVVLNGIEADLAKIVGTQRHDQNRKNGTNLEAVRDPKNDINGFGAELAVARIINTYPDLTIGPHRRGYDLNMRWRMRHYKIDVKSTTKDPGYLMAKHWRGVEDCDMYVHVSGTMPRYTIQGWVWSDELISPANLRDMGYGKHYYMEPDQLRHWKFADNK